MQVSFIVASGASNILGAGLIFRVATQAASYITHFFFESKKLATIGFYTPRTREYLDAINPFEQYAQYKLLKSIINNTKFDQIDVQEVAKRLDLILSKIIPENKKNNPIFQY